MWWGSWRRSRCAWCTHHDHCATHAVIVGHTRIREREKERCAQIKTTAEDAKEGGTVLSVTCLGGVLEIYLLTSLHHSLVMSSHPNLSEQCQCRWRWWDPKAKRGRQCKLCGTEYNTHSRAHFSLHILLVCVCMTPNHRHDVVLTLSLSLSLTFCVSFTLSDLVCFVCLVLLPSPIARKAHPKWEWASDAKSIWSGLVRCAVPSRQFSHYYLDTHNNNNLYLDNVW